MKPVETSNRGLQSLSPLSPRHRAQPSGAGPIEDRFSLSDSAEPELPFSRRIPAVILGVFSASMALTAGHAPQTAQVRVQPKSASTVTEKFQAWGLGRGEEAPRGQALKVIQEYLGSDFGQEMASTVVADFDRALAQGHLSADGEVTLEGQLAGYEPFRIVHGERGAQASLNRIWLPQSFPSHFAGSGQAILPVAILHHEFGHTKYGTPAGSADVVTDEHGSRLSVDHELEIVNRYENPVRLRYGYEPRHSYHNHLGEKAENPR